MIRFIDCGLQIDFNRKWFAWFDTTTDTFITVCDTQIWDSWEAFADDFACDAEDGVRRKEDIDRYESLFPKTWTSDASDHNPKE